MKTAKQMFEELGYEKKEESEGVLLYISDFENSILFEKKRVTITDLYCYGRITININHLLENAIHKQCEELGWLEEETCTNKLEYDSRDVFKCSNCGFISVHQTGVKSDEDNRVEFFYSYKPKYCPNCGSKIID